jgi:hypothetical protein
VAVAAAVGAGLLPARLGDPILTATFQWFLGNTMAQVVVTLMILYWCTRAYRHRNARIRELVIPSGASCRADGLVLGDSRTAHLDMFRAAFVWAAVRLRPFGTANAIALLSPSSRWWGGSRVGSPAAARTINQFYRCSCSPIIAVSLLSLPS